MRNFIYLTYILFITSTVSLSAQSFDINNKPAPSPEKWTGILGEYVLEGQKYLIREDGGRLHALLNPVDMNFEEDWPLNEIDRDKFTSNFQGKMINFIFKRDDNGNGTALIIDNEIYDRNHIEPRDGNTFKVKLQNGLEPLLKAALEAEPPVEQGDFRESDLVDITTVVDNVKLDVRYATTNNFLSVATYSEAKSFLQRPAIMAVNEANKKLNEMGYGILVHDAYRPWYVTKVFWDATEGPERGFVADPSKGSKHNRGCAIDMTLYELSTGKVVKMVGTYDEMSERSLPNYLGGTSLERWHRDLLRQAMENVGFRVNSVEWWHFDYKDWEKYPILNQKFDELTLN